MRYFSYTVTLIMAFIFGTAWIFNHVNAWLGIAIGLAGLIVAVNYIFKQIKKTEEK